MEEHSTKERFTEYTVFSVLIAILLFIFSLFLTLTTSKEADFSFRGVGWLFANEPIMWILSAFTVLLPLGVYLITKRFAILLEKKQALLDKEQSRIDQVNDFTQQLIHNNLDVEFKLTTENDSLGETLVNLRNALKINEENDKKLRQAEEQRNWIAEGSAHFSETLRNYIHEPDQLSFHVIKDLTKYVNAIQGGFYLLDDSDPYNRVFNLNAFFAYDRRKFADQKIKWGDGLIGTCAMEKKTIHLKGIPESYIKVTSGLGEATPDNLIVAPMIYEEQIYGVLELASFSAFESSHVALIEKTAESIAATLSAIKTNLRTAQLLEESKAQTQALTSHEEEMRQNMEELQATQEESTRQTQRLYMLEETLKITILQAEFDAEGRFVNGNNLFYSKFEYSSELKIEGKHIIEFIDEGFRERFNEIWQNLLGDNKPFKGYIKHVTRTGKDLWSIASLSSILHDDKSINKIMFLGIDATEERADLQKHEAIVQSVNNTSINLELDINGNLLECNELFINLFNLSQKDIKSMVIFDLISPIELESFNKRWDAIIHGTMYTGIIRGKSTKGDEIWLNGSFSITENTAHETDHVIFVGVDVTHEKHLETELHKALDVLKKQERQIRDAEKELGNKLRETKSELLGQFKEIEKTKNLNEKMLEEITDAVVTTSQDNRVVFFNKAAEQLWQLDRKDVIDQEVGMLFPESLVEKDELLGSFTRPGDHKITGKRKKGIIIDKNGKERPVFILLTKARADNENAYTAFIQLVDK
jgi:PAS domain S-box-containing protein